MKGKFTLEGLKSCFKKTGWIVSECYFDDGISGWELSQCSPAGEDFSFAIMHNNDVSQAIKEIREYAYRFDVDEHVEMWIAARDVGVDGVLGVCELVEDAEAIQEMLNELADGVEEWHESVKPALDDVIKSCSEQVNRIPGVDNKSKDLEI